MKNLVFWRYCCVYLLAAALLDIAKIRWTTWVVLLIPEQKPPNN